eukprot:96241-Rhodomonas_salina.3
MDLLRSPIQGPANGVHGERRERMMFKPRFNTARKHCAPVMIVLTDLYPPSIFNGGGIRPVWVPFSRQNEYNLAFHSCSAKLGVREGHQFVDT